MHRLAVNKERKIAVKLVLSREQEEEKKKKNDTRQKTKKLDCT